LDDQGIEFFVHSPFAIHTDVGMVDRNQCALVLQATLQCGDTPRHLLLTTDVAHDVLTDIVAVTRAHGNDERLAWDVVKVPHHCSYLSLSDEQGTTVTEPMPNVQWLFEQGPIVRRSSPHAMSSPMTTTANRPIDRLRPTTGVGHVQWTESLWSRWNTLQWPDRIALLSHATTLAPNLRSALLVGPPPSSPARLRAQDDRVGDFP
jgi:hypothetical protein